MIQGSSGYRITDHAACSDLTQPLYELKMLCFGRYPGVVSPAPAITRWYRRRPGMDPTLCMAALQGEQLVASLFVTVAEMRLGGRLLPVGIVDTVMTHPEHRRQGLARRLLVEALQRMRERGLAASLLYTFPDTVPFRLYQSLGYQPYAPTDYFHMVRSGGFRSSLHYEVRTNPPAEDVTAFLNSQLGESDGYIPLTAALWRWRKDERPAELPISIVAVEHEGRLAGCVTLCRAPITSTSGDAFMYVLADLAIDLAADGPAVLEALLQSVPAGAEVLAPVAQAERHLQALLPGAGLARQPGECGMVAPLSLEAAQALDTPPQSWYVAVESVVGV